ncbi:hypothetical protein Z042_13285 [Chania multitudinisentens RB-25]|uniref:Uncharacterized protein n=1 Tax=Chania multitudinisentens RB-25 TaxID=1441930 RepID=W0LGB7_9GAMM|nr:hypothetical protein [Chania multitudinisentens]AHG22791.1 hypothetical protein Z042_13285 [Chania multitudinisentens RB-25]
MRIILLVASLICAGLVQAEEGKGDYIYSEKVVKRFKITEVSPYKDYYLPSMRYQMLLSKFNDSDNTFCAIGYQLEDGFREAAVFWDKGKKIIRWQPEGVDFSDYSAKVSTLSHAYSPSIQYESVIPRKDITMADQVSYAKEDVDAMRADCEHNGEIITIKAFATPKACEEYNLQDFECIEPLLTP